MSNVNDEIWTRYADTEAQDFDPYKTERALRALGISNVTRITRLEYEQPERIRDYQNIAQASLPQMQRGTNQRGDGDTN